MALFISLLPARADAQAEHYGFFRFDLGMMSAYMSGTSGKGGGLVLEPMFNITDQISVGLRQELLVAWGDSIGASSASLSARAQTSTMAKGEYYFTTGGAIRPFASLGLGMYYIASQSMEVTQAGEANISQLGGKYFGLAPQAGIELSVVRLSLLYEMMLGAEVEVRQDVSTGGTTGPTSKSSLNYLGIELSFRIGGGRRD
jgi:hypothetical protein